MPFASPGISTPVISAGVSPGLALGVGGARSDQDHGADEEGAPKQGPGEAAGQRVRAGWCAASSELVRAVASADKMARPSATPTWKEAVMSAPARPALSGGTPALPAISARLRRAVTEGDLDAGADSAP